MKHNYQKTDTRLTETVLRSTLFWLMGLSLLIALGSTPAHALEPFEAKYNAYRHDRELGQATLNLEKVDGDLYRLTYHSKVSLFFLSDERKEVSVFSIGDNGSVLPVTYTYERTGTGKDKSLRAEFDEQIKSIKIKDKDDLPWQGELDNQLYRLDLQRKLASGETEFNYTLVNYRGQIRQYQMEVMGKETLDLPYGMVEGIKVKIVRESKKRETFAWFSPSLNYQLVRLQQFKEGEEQGDIRLSAFSTPATQ